MYRDRPLTARERRFIRLIFPGGWDEGASGPNIQKFVEILGSDNELVKAVLSEAVSAQDQMKNVAKPKSCKVCGADLKKLTTYSGEYCKRCSPAKNVMRTRAESKDEDSQYI